MFVLKAFFFKSTRVHVNEAKYRQLTPAIKQSFKVSHTECTLSMQCFKQSHNQRFTDITVLICLTMRHPGEDTSAAQILTFFI